MVKETNAGQENFSQDELAHLFTAAIIDRRVNPTIGFTVRQITVKA